MDAIINGRHCTRAESNAASLAAASNGSRARRPECGDHLGRPGYDRHIHRAARVGTKLVAIKLAVIALPLCPWLQGVLAETAVAHVGLVHDYLLHTHERFRLLKVPLFALTDLVF
jgi:hypothetical protein